MPFPEDKLGLIVEIQPGGVWTDITARCKTSDPIVHSRGIRNKGTVAEAATVPLKIDNKDGAFSPRNPLSPYDLQLNTPVRLWLPDGDHFLDLDGNPANYASTPDHAALDISGDLDLRWEGEANWYGPGAQILIGKWGDAGQRSYHLRLQDGRLYIHLGRDGIVGPAAFVMLPALPERAALRGTIEDGTTIRHYWAETITGPWTQLSEFDLSSPLLTGIHVGTAPLVIAPAQLDATPTRNAVAGKVYAAEVRDGIGGTLVAGPDFEAQPLGSAGFTDSAGRAWSYAGNAAVADRQDIFVGEISNWPQRWVPSEEAVWTPVTASGILRRLGQGAKPLDSTLRRRIPSGNPTAYWPFEEDSDASRASSPITGVEPAAVTGVEWAAVDTLPSSKALPKLGAAATLSAIVPEAADGQWQVEMVYNADDKAPPSSGPWAEVLSVSTTGTIRRLVVGLRDGSARIWGYDASGTDIIFASTSFTLADPFHGWFRLRIYVQDVGGGDLEWVVGLADVNGVTAQRGDTIAGTVGHVTAVTANWGPLTEGWSIGHLSVMPTAANTIYDGSDSAYSGETAWERLRRLAGEQGLPMARIPGGLTPERVGPQRSIRLLESFQAAADADGGMLLEDRRRRGLVYRDRSSMYTQDPALTLTYKQPPLAPPLEPDDEADVTRNDRTVKRDGGSEARAILTEGRLSIQDPPGGIGLYDDSVTLSLASDVQTQPIAYWLLHLGTYDGARYPAVTVRLHRAPDMIPQVLAMREGDLIRIQGLPGFVAYGDMDLIVTGWSETLLPHTWTRTFVCEPGGPWNTAVADHAVYGKADTDGSELAAAATSTSTALEVTATDGRMWTASARESPWDIEVGGEVATVTAVGRLLNANAFFHTDVANWTTLSCTIARSTAVVHPRPQARASMLITPAGGVATIAADSDLTATDTITPGATYVISGWFYSPLGWSDLRPSVHWYTNGGTFISTSGAAQAAVPAGVWTYLENTVTAPATAGRAKMRARSGGTPAASDVFYVWAMRLIPTAAGLAVDTFGRTSTDSWGTSDSGHAWQIAPTANSADFDVASGVGTIGINAVNSTRRAYLPSTVVLTDADVRVQASPSVLASAGNIETSVMLRVDPADIGNTYLYGEVEFNHQASRTVRARIVRRQAGTDTALSTAIDVPGLTYTAGSKWWIRFQALGSRLRLKVWADGSVEPTGWHVDVTDSVLTSGRVGLRTTLDPANTNTLPVLVNFDNFEVLNPQRFTVERSKNGVVIAHPEGEPVRLAATPIASL